ncbi:hypothetical protein Salat_2120600 [Sesamum alatum]|uniref:Uncharacterized protein n=1 Tax=Sesamum alatum TaxID=300844 RepID=A0AAE2CGZ3_9LAMI|nr:hypothetical protein Salat_2120600 [Sesamum alatum]
MRFQAPVPWGRGVFSFRSVVLHPLCFLICLASLSPQTSRGQILRTRSGGQASIPPRRPLDLSAFVGMEAFCSRLGRNLQLNDSETSGLSLPDELLTVDSGSHNLFLVDRVLSTKQSKFKALAASVKSMLNLVKALEM